MLPKLMFGQPVVTLHQRLWWSTGNLPLTVIPRLICLLVFYLLAAPMAFAQIDFYLA